MGFGKAVVVVVVAALVAYVVMFMWVNAWSVFHWCLCNGMIWSHTSPLLCCGQHACTAAETYTMRSPSKLELVYIRVNFTYKGLNEIAAFSLTIFSNAFLKKCLHLYVNVTKIYSWIPLIGKTSALVQVMAYDEPDYPLFQWNNDDLLYGQKCLARPRAFPWWGSARRWPNLHCRTIAL